MDGNDTFVKCRRAIRAVGAVMLAAVLAAVVAPAHAQDRGAPGNVQFFRIGTGPTTGVYFPVGAMIASVISNPPGSRACARGGSCGVPNLIAVAQATQDSIDRLSGIADRRIESALVQSDVAYLAYAGKGPFSRARVANLRVIAKLYPEYLQIVARTDIPIRSFADLKGKRVGLDTDGSGTRIMAQTVLPQMGIKPTDMAIRAITVSSAADQMRARRLDAFAFTSGLPADSIQRLAEDMPIRLLPVAPAIAERIAKSDRPGLFPGEIPGDVYKGVPATPTVATDALWVVSADIDADLVYELTRALWHPNNRRLLTAGHPAGRSMRPEAALEGLTIPLHPGAERYYRDMGYEIPTTALAPVAAPRPSVPRPGSAPGR
jgi:TRAP transporter TAXI family solute receptor